MAVSPTVKFNDGNTIPQLGYGVWQVKDDVAEKVVGLALDAGFRHIDTARIYGNEAGVGRALAASSVNRDDVFVTTKVWNEDQGYESTLAAFDASMKRLGIETLDLLLIHWASVHRGLYLETWKAFIELQKSGRVKSIGVSNFPEEQLREIVAETGVTPAIHQIELHPFFNQEQLRKVNNELGIVTQAWSPLGQGGDILTHETITKIAEKHDATPAQVVIAWHLAIGNVVIPKSVTPERIVENFEALNITLEAKDVDVINALSHEDGRIGPDPAKAEF
ncbi:aldo/keto reductase [Rothia sp. ZJ932]|uniref:aldo/keto reductase n=1 Tax=Rothia sp. ZJ932 TaxID=2810516 RepID=UPI001967B71F|nr:aldo/keto reductase [Rothia sp. ZJ932]QRZ61278.1 aldo/keto reductase [Rothia sp. ZJ932]